MMPSVYLKSVTIRRFKQFEDVVFDLSTTREYSFNQEVLTEDGRFVKTALVYGQNGAVRAIWIGGDGLDASPHGR